MGTLYTKKMQGWVQDHGIHYLFQNYSFKNLEDWQSNEMNSQMHS